MSSVEVKILLDYNKYKHLMTLYDKANATPDTAIKEEDVTKEGTSQTNMSDMSMIKGGTSTSQATMSVEQAEKDQNALLDHCSQLQQIIRTNEADAKKPGIVSDTSTVTCPTPRKQNDNKIISKAAGTSGRKRKNPTNIKKPSVKNTESNLSNWYCIA